MLALQALEMHKLKVSDVNCAKLLTFIDDLF
jgi:hypothetical protein